MRPATSGGVALYRGDPKITQEDLLRQADTALYQAKKRGRNCYQLAPETEDEQPG